MIKPAFDETRMVTESYGVARKGKDITPFVVLKDKVVFEKMSDTTLRKVKLASNPEGAEVYRIHLYDYRGVTDISILLNEDTRVPEGKTPTATYLSSINLP